MTLAVTITEHGLAECISAKEKDYAKIEWISAAIELTAQAQPKPSCAAKSSG